MILEITDNGRELPPSGAARRPDCPRWPNARKGPAASPTSGAEKRGTHGGTVVRAWPAAAVRMPAGPGPGWSGRLFWQFTESVTASGVPAKVDENVCAGNSDALNPAASPGLTCHAPGRILYQPPSPDRAFDSAAIKGSPQLQRF
jgi:hypothetical protein